MQYTHTWEKVMNDEKTETSRLVKGVNLVVDEWGNTAATDVPDFLDGLQGAIQVVTTENGRKLYEVGQIHPVQPGRSLPTIQYAALRTVDGVINRVVTDDDGEFLWTFARPLQIKILKIWYEDVRNINEASAKAEGFPNIESFIQTWAMMHDKAAVRDVTKFNGAHICAVARSRPAQKYTAWRLKIERVGVQRKESASK